MTLLCRTLVVNEKGYSRKSKLRLDAVCDQTISNYEWSFDSVVLSNNTTSITIDLSSVALGIHSLSLRTQVSCGSWSSTVTKQINIIDDIPPIISSVGLSNKNVVVGDSILVTVTATDDISIRDITANEVLLATTGLNTWTGTIIAINGTNTVTITATDTSGNISIDTTQSYTAIQAISRLTTISISPLSSNISKNGYRDYIAVAKDQYSVVMRGIYITWTSGDVLLGRLTPKITTTDINGETISTFFATNKLGTTTITATSGTIISNIVNISVVDTCNSPTCGYTIK